MTSRSNRPRHPMQAFQVDPGWYAEHWLEEAPPRPAGWSVATLARALAAAGRVMRGARRLTLRLQSPATPELARPGPR
ncbi:hypothetical protein [Falsiroseomonas sp. HW251]|uniref:hypothetical protein n=1 Tax=Falsiroseomonas sp. HW251 TaxID=3390998 RepID=UPI003D31EBA2